MCVSIDAKLEATLRPAAPLTEYAWKFRYPGEHSMPTPEETEAALKLASRVVKAISERLPPEAWPAR